ncbi:MAG: hypothetical protein KGP28_03855 [Bdellovibrionales bacterium]|nr:hypothetical protein [Bdellovibrionales bacterium]
MKSISLNHASALLVLLIPALSEGSALLMKDEKKREITFFTRFIYRGKAMTPKLALDSTREIASLWNESKGSVMYRGREYRAKFVFSYATDAGNRMPDSGSCAENHVMIEAPAARGDRSFYSMSGRFGTFYTSDDLGRSTTTAHEYGHGLGLDHDPYEQLNAGVPGIMFARGTLVKSRYQWNPSAAPGAAGGSIKPHHRRVRAEDLRKLNVDSVGFVGSVGCLGDGVLRMVSMSNPVLPEPVPASVQHLLESSPFSPDLSEEMDSEAHDH